MGGFTKNLSYRSVLAWMVALTMLLLFWGTAKAQMGQGMMGGQMMG